MSERKLTPEEEQIIRLGRANDRLNKYVIPISMPFVVVAVILVFLYGSRIWPSSVAMVLGGCFLMVGVCIPVVWFLTLTIRASSCNYNYDRYLALLKEVNPEEAATKVHPGCATAPALEPVAERITTAEYIQQFDGDVRQALTHILNTYEGEVLGAYADEWTADEREIAQQLYIESGKAYARTCTRKCWTQIGITAAIVFGLPLLLWLLKDVLPYYETVEKYVYGGIALFITLQALRIGPLLVESIRCRHTLRKLTKQKNAS